MTPPIKGKYLSKPPSSQGDFGSNMIELTLLVQQLQSIKTDATSTVNAKILELEAKVNEKISEIESVINDSEKAAKILQNSKEEAIALIANIKKGDPGKDADPVDVEKLKEDILAEIPKVDVKSLTKSVLEMIPENKASLKIIQEKFEADPMTVIDKIMELAKEGKFKLKQDNIDGLKQTMSAFSHQLSKGYLHGGGFSNIYKDGTLVTNGLTGLNFTGIDVTSVSKNASTGIVSVNISAADISVSLADVSVNSTTTPLSLYTMTSGIPVEFKTSGGGHLLYLDETNSRIGISTSSPTFKLDVQSGDIRVKGGSGYGAWGLSSLSMGQYTAGDYSWIQSGGASAGNSLSLNPAGGNVGIGTVSPTEQLQLTGNMRFDSSTPRIRVTSGAAANKLIIDQGGYGNSDIPEIDIQASTYPWLQLSSLDSNSGNRNWSIHATYSVYGTLEIRSSTAQGGNPASGGVARLVIDRDGQVGIGTTAPTKTLDVVGTSKISTSLQTPYIDMATGGSFNATNLSFTSAGSKYGTIQTENMGGAGAWSLGYQTSPGTTLGTPVLTWRGDGKVGIGITNAGSQLSVSSASLSSVPALGANGGQLSLVGDSGNYGMIMGVLTSGDTYIQTQRVDGSATAYHLLLQPNGGNAAVGLSNGTPTHPFVVSKAGDSSFTGSTPGAFAVSYPEALSKYVNLDFESPSYSGSAGRIGMYATGGGSYLLFGTSNNYVSGITNTAMAIDPSGQVGIGTTAPGSILHLYNTGGNTIQTIEQTAGGGGSVLKLVGDTGRKNWIIAKQFNVANAIEFTPSTAIAGNTFTTPVMTMLDSGNVGIGTTGPTAPLAIGVGANATPTNTKLWIAGAAGASGTTIQNRINLGIDTNQDYGAYLGSINLDGTGSGVTAVIGTRGNGTDVNGLYVRNGNVGIGTTNPNTNLDVNGFIEWSGQSRVSTQFDKTSDTTLSAITGLSSTLVAGKTYQFRVELHITAGAIGGEVVDLGGGTATATSLISQVNVLANTTNVYAETSRQTSLTGASAGVAGDTAYYILISGTITVNAGGTFKPRIAQKVSNGTATSVLVGSNMEINQLN